MIAAMKLKDACSLEEKLWQPRQRIKEQRHHFGDKGPYSQSYCFPSSHVWMWELDHKEGWAPKELIPSNHGAEEDSWESLDCKEIKPVNPKWSQPWIFIGRTNAEAEAPILWPPDEKSTGMDKEDVVYIYNGIIAIKRDEIVPFAETWMYLETVIQTEVRKRKINIILIHICEI